MTGIGQLGSGPALSAAPEHVRVSVLGGRTQLDVALPMDIPLAHLLPELVKLVRSRDVESSTDTPWAATRDAFWVVSRVEPPRPLKASQTLRAAGVADGELLRLADERPPSAPTLYDDVVDAAARLKKATYAGWDAAAARRMSFAALALAALLWSYLLIAPSGTPQHGPVVAIAVLVAVALPAGAALAHRSYGRADIAAAVGWSGIPILTALMWVGVRGFGAWGIATGCAALVVVSIACYRAIGCGRWGYLSSGVLYAGAGLAALAHALGAAVPGVGAMLAASGALACLLVPVMPATLRPRMSATRRPDGVPAPADAAATPLPLVAMPTAEQVWDSARAATTTRSAVYIGLAAWTVCGVATVLRATPEVGWAAIALAGVGAAALGMQSARVDGPAERVALAGPALALAVMAAVGAQGGPPTIAWAGTGALLAVAVLASTAAAICTRSKPNPWRVRAWAYVHYAMYAAVIPAALWAVGAFTRTGTS